jgi:hypothetical protein
MQSRPRPERTPSAARYALLALAVGVLTVHTAFFGEWLVDDAGISFAYSRNLAEGFGLVSQPGLEPVECFSNPLWTIGLAPFFATGTFQIPWTVKLLSLALVTAAFMLIVRHGLGAWLAACPPLLIALNTSFVVWCASGLENPLLALLATLSAALALRAAEGETGRLDITAGLVAALLALTRPDAVLYAVCYPLTLALTRSNEGLRGLARRVLTHALGFSVLFGPYLAFRLIYFHEWVPNTFHAKVSGDLLALDPLRLWDLLESATGRLALPVIVLLIAALVRTLSQRGRDPRRLVLMLHLLVAGAAYVLLPPDWMGEYRFATAFFVFLYWSLGDALAELWQVLTAAGSRARWLAPLTAILLLAEGTRLAARRSTDMAVQPVVPFARVAAFTQAYDRLADLLDAGPHSFLGPDLGGTLFYGKLRVFDLAGLCDREVARTLMNDTPAFHEYVFERARPTFIHFHGSWGIAAALHSDPRFARDYLPLHETWEWPRRPARPTAEPWSADYVRRQDAPTPERLESLRRSFVQLGLTAPLP